MVAESGCEAVGGVKFAGHLILRDLQVALYHACDLLLGGSAVAGDGLLDTHRDVFGDGDIAREGCRHRHTLGAAELEHTLDVLPEEGGFDSQLVRVEFIDEALHPLEDALEAEVMVLVLAEADDPESQETCLLPTDLDEAVAHDDGPGVDAHDDAL